MTVLGEVNSRLENIDFKKIERLDTRQATYATDATQTSKLNNNLPFVFNCDKDGELKRVDVGECVHTCNDVLAELGRKAFGVVYLNKLTKERPSIVLKIVSPLQKYANTHEYKHLSKFKHCPYFVWVVTGSLKD